MFTVLLALHIIIAIAMVGFILLQHGKGADAGASFGAGAAGTVFGAAGSANFMTRATAILATIFFVTSLGLAWYAQKQADEQRRLDIPVIHTTQPPSVPPSTADAVPAVETAEPATSNNQ
ncbi:preprotein translocase subunit SecG [Moraxella sp. Pampa]|uniref:preprotein translocase subunit SecG n=1 Tax=Moraxella sp. Pampa TaxID=3111978 RepID=UPI002B405D3C|nr:preprotein translocase subunit SecG [Moraxella sp. Pampa]